MKNKFNRKKKIGYSLTSVKMEEFTENRDLRKILEYLFVIYDENSDSNLTKMEVEKILGGWCKIIVSSLKYSINMINIIR
jgi:Ca2+-binding EF-hand superfamily protein